MSVQTLARLVHVPEPKGAAPLDYRTPSTLSVDVECWLGEPRTITYSVDNETERDDSLRRIAQKINKVQYYERWPLINAYISWPMQESNGKIQEGILFCRISRESHLAIIGDLSPRQAA